MSYDYDVLGETTKVRENGATTGVGVLGTYAYDDLGRRTSLTRGNGAVTTYAFDSVSRLASLAQNPAGTTRDLTLGFSYNRAGQIAGVTRGNDAYAWTGAVNASRAYTTNGLNQYTASGGTTLGYDTRGNTSSPPGAYTYSSENLLKTGPASTTLAYDPLLRLFQVSQGKRLLKAGLGARSSSALHAPIGAVRSGKASWEVAVSVIAEIMQTRTDRSICGLDDVERSAETGARKDHTTVRG